MPASPKDCANGNPISSDLHVLETARQTITDHRMLEATDRLLVGVSGGSDSIALLDILHRITADSGVSLAVAHLNHGLRTAAEAEAEFVRRQADAMDLQCFVDTIDLTPTHRGGTGTAGIEAAARDARYAFYRRICDGHGYTRVAVGHQRDDNAEQVLINLLRGTGPRGLSGIPPVRDHWIIRPLIRLGRDELAAYRSRRGLRCTEDESNRDTRYLRNRIRHELMPLLRAQYNPGISDHLNRLADIMRCEDRWLTGMVEDRLETLLGQQGRDILVLDRAGLIREHQAMQRRLLRAAICRIKGDLRRIDAGHVAELMRMLADAKTPGGCDLPGGIRAEVTAEALTLYRHAGRRQRTGPVNDIPLIYRNDIRREDLSPSHAFQLDLTAINARMVFSVTPPSTEANGIHIAGHGAAMFDMDMLAFPLVIRNYQPGDRFGPRGLDGTQKVKKFFIDHKVPKADRIRYPVVCDGDRIIWVAGLRQASTGMVTEQTREVLTIEFRWLSEKR